MHCPNYTLTKKSKTCRPWQCCVPFTRVCVTTSERKAVANVTVYAHVCQLCALSSLNSSNALLGSLKDFRLTKDTGPIARPWHKHSPMYIQHHEAHSPRFEHRNTWPERLDEDHVLKNCPLSCKLHLSRRNRKEHKVWLHICTSLASWFILWCFIGEWRNPAGCG